MSQSILSWPTLVLNKGWRGINATTVKKAIKKVNADRARIICHETFGQYTYDEWIDLSRDAITLDRMEDKEPRPYTLVSGQPFCYPRIIVATKYNQFPNKVVVFSRKNLWQRDGKACQYCGCKPRYDELTIDHVIPKSKGGKTEFPNCVLACIKCNLKKRDRTPEQAGMQLRRRLILPDGHEDWEFYSTPDTPRWNPLYSIKTTKINLELIRDSWSKFLPDAVNFLYWNTELEN